LRASAFVSVLANLGDLSRLEPVDEDLISLCHRAAGATAHGHTSGNNDEVSRVNELLRLDLKLSVRLG
jgi:hypothetical protein